MAAPKFFLNAIPVGNKLVPIGKRRFTAACGHCMFALQNSKDVLNCTPIVKASDHLKKRGETEKPDE